MNRFLYFYYFIFVLEDVSALVEENKILQEEVEQLRKQKDEDSKNLTDQKDMLTTLEREVETLRTNNSMLDAKVKSFESTGEIVQQCARQEGRTSKGKRTTSKTTDQHQKENENLKTRLKGVVAKHNEIVKKAKDDRSKSKQESEKQKSVLQSQQQQLEELKKEHEKLLVEKAELENEKTKLLTKQISLKVAKKKEGIPQQVVVFAATAGAAAPDAASLQKAAVEPKPSSEQSQKGESSNVSLLPSPATQPQAQSQPEVPAESFAAATETRAESTAAATATTTTTTTTATGEAEVPAKMEKAATAAENMVRINKRQLLLYQQKAKRLQEVEKKLDELNQQLSEKQESIVMQAKKLEALSSLLDRQRAIYSVIETQLQAKVQKGNVSTEATNQPKEGDTTTVPLAKYQQLEELYSAEKAKSQQNRQQLKEIIATFNALEKTHNEMKGTCETLQSKVQTLQAQKEGWLEERVHLQRDLDNAKTKIETLEKQSQMLREEIKTRERRIQSDEEKLLQMQRLLDELQSKSSEAQKSANITGQAFNDTPVKAED
ncbi:hypothetical protein RFI_06241, partial [Reticulomyxa filosa]